MVNKGQMLSVSYFRILLWGLLVMHNFLPAGTASCPKGWLSYFSNCYGLFPEQMTREEAKEECQSIGQGGHLASILSDQELAMVTRYITTQFKGVGNVWIGLKDRWRIRRWKWDDGSKTTDLHWTSGVPSIFTGSKYCAYMIELEDYKTWRDADCSEEYAFLCKMKS
ncbi:C-type lectin LmsL-like [Eublepharis macularius]|uniref:C-type lectin LmsL-like n=1 Tax=Eublepharis macularius TaxID=481883 RepID=A0AA97L6Z5_EUBMA|nr:C-type lectin LmsL-like [Eublepharis macularius]